MPTKLSTGTGALGLGDEKGTSAPEPAIAEVEGSALSFRKVDTPSGEAEDSKDIDGAMVRDMLMSNAEVSAAPQVSAGAGGAPTIELIRQHL